MLLLCGALALTVLALLCKLLLIYRSLDEIARELSERLEQDSNNLLFLPSRDRRLRRAASALNAQLRRLRAQRWRYQSGDQELKEAVTNISHDLRTPLTAICGYLELLEREPESLPRYLPLLTGRAQAMKLLTEELFRYSVILSAEGELRPERVCLNSALEESLAAFYAALCQRGVTPEISLCGEKVFRLLDREALSRVFGNILSNAVKYSGGDLEVRLRESGEVLFANAAPGLDEIQAGRLFDRFFTLEAARNSTGLGLAIAKSLVERMGGTIEARCEGGRLEIRVRF